MHVLTFHRLEGHKLVSQRKLTDSYLLRTAHDEHHLRGHQLRIIDHVKLFKSLLVFAY